MIGDLYILVGHAPIPVADVRQHCTWMHQHQTDTIVGLTRFGTAVYVSTIFLGIDSDRCTPPLLFETMVFGGTMDGTMTRYATWEEALAGHERIVAEERAALEGEHHESTTTATSRRI